MMIPDPLDARLGYVLDERRGRRRRWSRLRLALGLSPTPVPGLVLLPLGMALGPHGIGLLSPTVLSYLDPAVSVAIATLGVFVGLGLDPRRPHEGRLLAAASVEAAFTMSAVAFGVLVALRQAPLDTGLPPWVVALILGICAAASSTTAIEHPDRAALHAARIGDLDDVLTIVLGGIALAALRESNPGAALSLVGQWVLITLMVALAGWLLVAGSDNESEQRVFVLGTLLLLGGTVEYLSLSGLLSGLLAGALWNAAGGAGRERFSRDVRHVQHPLVVLLLVVAGAHVTTWSGLSLLVPMYLFFRIAGKMGGGWLAARVAPQDLPAKLGLYLISPGVIAVAFALNVVQAAGRDRSALLTVAVVGALVSELISLLVHPREEAP